GYSVYTGSSTSLIVAGDSRGWKKVRILRNGTDGYKIQYADISDTTHQEITVGKNSAYHFTFLSLEKGIADVQPPKDNWDLCFTVFVNENVGYGTYTFADFVNINIMNNTGAYQVLTSEVGSYEDFTKDMVDHSKFIYDDHRAIGSNWRQTAGGVTVFTDRFYILKDNLGTLYKIKFLKMTNNENLRGYPEFEYNPLF
ncbi:MAG: HmuY family protein, partial [Flavobacteriaceae bacterium]|nr:HmuY family protein [Flavobacteriaceae bacterium]